MRAMISGRVDLESTSPVCAYVPVGPKELYSFANRQDA